MAPRLDGPRIEAASGHTKQLVVILHGFGADGRDLIGLGEQWAQVLPDAAFVAPSAADVCEHMPEGRQWFRLTDRNPHERWTGACSAAPLLNAFIDEELARYGLPGSKVALVGFSQGAMMALHVGLRRKQAPAAVLSYSGVLVGPERLEEAIAGRPAEALPAMFLIHGSHDEVIPIDALFGSANAIQAAGGACQWRVAHGMGHNIDAEGLSHGAIFLARSLGLPFPEPLKAR